MKDWELIKSLFQVQNPQGLDEKKLRALKGECGELPAVLEDFYRIFGEEPIIVRIQDELIFPSHPAFKDQEYLIFFNENQGVCQAGVRRADCHMPDPPVYVDYRAGKWVKTCGSLSEFLMAMYCQQAALCLEYTPEAFYWITDEELEIVRQNFKELPYKIEDWVNAGISVYSNNESVMVAVMDSGDFMMFYGANNEKDFEEMRQILKEIGEEV